jgi:ribonucleoside-diphosphate reductase beta chain
MHDKRIINSKTDVNQLVPFKYKWSWEKYLSSCANNVDASKNQHDAGHCTVAIPTAELKERRRIIKRNLGFFVT